MEANLKKFRLHFMNEILIAIFELFKTAFFIMADFSLESLSIGQNQLILYSDFKRTESSSNTNANNSKIMWVKEFRRYMPKNNA